MRYFNPCRGPMLLFSVLSTLRYLFAYCRGHDVPYLQIRLAHSFFSNDCEGNKNASAKLRCQDLHFFQTSVHDVVEVQGEYTSDAKTKTTYLGSYDYNSSDLYSVL
ncbi:hypothetical protein F4777DRAFT_469186 [Nemania sp. FL0916]|nr:hypothetical protein F4777DRAFT_469186 [Nemania sp. FL0916]